MEERSSDIVIRPARPEDRSAVLAFCVDTFSWGDYIPDVWDAWLSEPDGELMVADLNGLAVGVQHLSFPSAGEAWLQGMRIDPAVRRHGIATALLNHGLEVARTRGARIARLMTKVDNTPVQHMMVAHGFHRLGAYTDLRGAADDAAGLPEAAVLGDLDAIWRLAGGSETLAAAGGTYVWAWRSQLLTYERLRGHVAKGEAFVVRREGRPAAFALAEREQDDASVWAGTFCGDDESVELLAGQLRGYAARMTAKEAMAYVPNLPSLVSALRAAGYADRAADHVPDMDLFAKDLSEP